MKVYIVKSYTVVMYGWESWTIKKLSSEELMLSNCGAREDSWESLGQKDHQTRKATPKIHWKDWFWSWNFNTLATWCEELTHWKRPWCWEGLKVGGEGVDRGWDGWMASRTQWTWVWVNPGSWWWTGRPGLPQSMGLQRVGHDWATELNWQILWLRCAAYNRCSFHLKLFKTQCLSHIAKAYL